ncbi:DUF4197 domain-containing protein [Empedobacter falsenii]|uniref:DUF4197 domain-containing protein n=1 Tax=Empedobacter falsenii TaxID=343874 RepID=A0A3R8URI6_9FLAO|nr:DUF4197 domain-containing protein [Empedobacter falsenii]MBW1619519.1 DUF4197 domain-containing protein [Empedobacter falsenii]MBY0066380.1 DUF4197 domain-containing protein [Empedobacter falsenii]RRT93789.1 DUF4197 domain-containing protein [Empedobacter falsenii]RRT93944.1 DUF4197 domain-containing protein [Empedobacter falsenii]
MKKIILSLTLISAFAVNSKAQDLKSIFGTLKKEVEKVNTQTTTQNNSTVKVDSIKVVNGSTESKTISAESLTKLNGLSNATVASGLKEALSLGLTDGIKSLGQKNGFYNNSVAKILMPEELQNVEKTLRSLGMGSLADKGIKLLNSAAEDAVSEAAPIFVNAVTSMTITDAKDILLGGNNSATNYLKLKTTSDLTKAFQPKVEASLGKVGADKVWNNLITKYNTLTGNQIDPNLNAYVTQQTINGVFNMVAEKEEGIRGNKALRTTSLLQQVFGAQDSKK